MKAHIDEPVNVGDILRVSHIIPSQDGYGYVILDFAKGYEVAALQARVTDLEAELEFSHTMTRREIETGAFLINGHRSTIDYQANRIAELESEYAIMNMRYQKYIGGPEDDVGALKEKIAEQAAYIERLEEAFKQEWLARHQRGSYGMTQEQLEKIWEEDRQRAREALERLKK